MTGMPAPDLPDGVVLRGGIPYAEAGGRKLCLDLYLPQHAQGPAPVTLYFHGGGWRLGQRTDRSERMAAVAARGVAVASASYRLSGEATFPAQLEDARAAAQWLRRSGAEHGLATRRIGAWGASAGGHLALLLGTDSGNGGSPADAVVAYFPPVDLIRLEREPPPPDIPRPPFLSGPPPVPSFAARLLGQQHVDDDADLARAASPLHHAASAGGPVLLIHGDRDGLIPSSQSRAMHDSLRAAGRDSTLLLLAGANHEDPAFEQPAVVGAVAGFLKAALAQG